MKALDISKKGETEYDAICGFARRIYREKLDFNLTKFPEIFFTIHDGRRLAGCMGLNRSLTCPLFINDSRYPDIKKMYGGEAIGEQSVLAIDSCFMGISFLAVAMFEYAYFINIFRAAFAGTEVAFKALELAGIKTDRHGFADPEALSPVDRPNYAKWFSSNQPVLATIHTLPVVFLSEPFFRRMKNRVAISGGLAEELYFYRKSFKSTPAVP